MLRHHSHIVATAALFQSCMHPNAWRVIHVGRLTTTSLTYIFTASKIGIVQTSIQSGYSIDAGAIRIPRVVLFATVVQSSKNVVNHIVGHVLWFISVADAASSTPFPIRIPERPGANTPFIAHAHVEVPSKVRGATFVQARAQISTWVGRHVARFVTIVLTSKASCGPVWVK